MGTEKASLTKELKAYVQEIGIDVFGIANIDRINKRARIEKRPEDLFPSAKSIVIFGCGMVDPFCRGWVKNGNINQDCDRCLRVCPKGELHWREEK